MTEKCIAQLNIARALYELDDPRLDDFMNSLDEINALVDASPGFVWRLQDETGNATDVQIPGDERAIVNISVWRDIDSLFDYAYKSAHTSVLRRRGEWFEKHDVPGMVLWWVDAGHVPTLDEGLERLEHLRAHGASKRAFSFKERF